MQPNAPAKNPGHAPGINPQGLKDLWHYNLSGHKPTADAERRINSLRSASKALADAIIDLTPPGRDQALSLTGLENTLTAAIHAIERSDNEENSGTPEEDKALSAPTPPPAGTPPTPSDQTAPGTDTTQDNNTKEPN